MQTFIIQVNLRQGTIDNYRLLAAAMHSNNMMLVKSDAVKPHEFAYYGNAGILYLTNIVKKSAMATGCQFSFTVVKDKHAAKQLRKLPGNAYRQTA